ncbi:hypothetical protein PEC18_30695 [Paucibacter sp. O1-1]|nr:hypothetical protein [Paucibacter sp. O1-1]MDA3830078.1 hypothetical protein [Paucibacter sp. O1-1]
MINKQFVKTKMPALFNFVKQQPLLFRVAKSVDRRLSARAYAKLNTDKKGYTQEEVQHLLNLAKAQGLFDYAWYSANQCRVFTCEQEAFEDYLTKGAFSCVNPSPAFDTELYYKCNTDIYLQGEQALVHYMSHGKAEGRMSPPATPKWHPKAIETTADGDATEHKIAMCFHVFYGEFIDYYCKSLEKFPQSVDVFVSVSSDDLVENAQTQFAACSKVNKVKVKVVPNHGRNFGYYAGRVCARFTSLRLVLPHALQKVALFWACTNSVGRLLR